MWSVISASRWQGEQGTITKHHQPDKPLWWFISIRMARKMWSAYDRSRLSFTSPCELNMQMARPLKSQTYSWSLHFTYSFCSVIFLLPNQTFLTSSNVEPYSIRPLYVCFRFFIYSCIQLFEASTQEFFVCACEIATPSNLLTSPPSRPIKRHERGTDRTWVE